MIENEKQIESAKEIIKSFSALEYHQDTKFYSADYRYEGSTKSGWIIFRNDKKYLTLPPGYVLLKTLSCGICSTDIARHNLPFPLPQVIGHEVVALHKNSMVVVDINASHKHLGDVSKCEYCRNGLENHCPDRLTLGIDRLPGGFAPYILVPQNAIIPLPENMDIKLASIVEPFAAALHAVVSENIQQGDSVAIIGPRRLGSLLILALKLWREKNKIDFNITAIIRDKNLEEQNENLNKLCELSGADEVIDVNKARQSAYDIVFDTSGSVSGFMLALEIARRIVHVKSTNGQVVGELKYLTEMVIDELSLSLISDSVDEAECLTILVDSSIAQSDIDKIVANYSGAEITIENLAELNERSDRCFDLAIGGTFDFINTVVRNGNGNSLIKPKGKIFLMGRVNDFSTLQKALNRGVKINTSRCGDFSEAIKLFQENMPFTMRFLEFFISGVYSAENLEESFERAKTDKKLIKVLVKH